MKYLEAKFTVLPDLQDTRDIMAALAAEAGFESFNEDEGGLSGYVQTDLFDKLLLDRLISDFPYPDAVVTYELSEVEDRNWNEQWEQKGFAPIVIDGKCIIYDYNHPSEDIGLFDTPMAIAIDAKQAFGTGNHETTRLMVAALLNMETEGKRVLDCGCGTGILGIVAAKQGASEVMGYDIDDWSVKNAIHNAEINHVELDILEGDSSVTTHINGVFDIVMANINRNVLLADLPAFAGIMNQNGLLILSGFYEDDAPLLIEKAASLGLKPCKKTVKDNWCCLIFK